MEQKKNGDNLLQTEIERRTVRGFIEELSPGEIFVFGSTPDGHHGGGTARMAYDRFGALWGKGAGFYGQSYALPVMQNPASMQPYVNEFIAFAAEHPDRIFLVTEIGYDIADFSPKNVAPLFKKAVNVSNIHLPRSFWHELQIIH
ncbi:MAG: hypothetical protein LBR08_02495 [Bacteroidales bacterium]|jgi:hypothetical protein|nr:hypothetical protein [Bacteroidales bacterium]